MPAVIVWRIYVFTCLFEITSKLIKWSNKTLFVAFLNIKTNCVYLPKLTISYGFEDNGKTYMVRDLVNDLS